MQVLLRLLKMVAARRGPTKPSSPADLDRLDFKKSRPADEVVEVLDLSRDTRSINFSSFSVQIGETVVKQLRQYVSDIASMYRENSFHNFEVCGKEQLYLNVSSISIAQQSFAKLTFLPLSL